MVRASTGFKFPLLNGDRHMEFATVSLHKDIRRIGDFIELFDAQEKELLAVGRDYLDQAGYQAGNLGQKIATAGGASNAATVLIALGLTVATHVAGEIYLRKKKGDLETKRREFAQANGPKIEELGYLLRENLQRMLGHFAIQEHAGLFSVDRRTLANYLPWLKANVRFQQQFFILLGRYLAFQSYYVHIEEWAGRAPKPFLLQAAITDDWFLGRARNAERVTQSSSSLVYNFSLQGHLLLFLPIEAVQVLPDVKRLHARARTLFQWETSRLNLLERFDYLVDARDLLGDSAALRNDVSKKYYRTKRKVAIYKKRFWIIGGILLIVFTVVLIVALILSLLSSLINQIFG